MRMLFDFALFMIVSATLPIGNASVQYEKATTQSHFAHVLKNF